MNRIYWCCQTICAHLSVLIELQNNKQFLLLCIIHHMYALYMYIKIKYAYITHNNTFLNF